MVTFKIGDLVRGSSQYGYTNEQSICKIVDTRDSKENHDDILVELIDHPIYKDHIGKKYWISSKHVSPYVKLEVLIEW